MRLFPLFDNNSGKVTRLIEPVDFWGGRVQLRIRVPGLPEKRIQTWLCGGLTLRLDLGAVHFQGPWEK